MATAPAKSFTDLKRDIKQGNFAPVYLLHGEESYFTDVLTDMFEEVLPEGERDFNLYVLYAPQNDLETVASTCQRYPVMAPRQMVILKEAQSVTANELSKLIPYVQHATATTVLVIVSRGEKCKSTALTNAVKKAGVVFEAGKLKDAAVDTLMAQIVKEHGLTIEAKAMAMLRVHIGNDVSRIYNELDKLAMILGKGSTVTPESVERNIGISKDYNNFEFIDSIAARDMRKSFEILKYFRSDPKRNPAVVTATVLYNYFSNLTIAHFTQDKSPRSLLAATGLKWESQLKGINTGLRNYTARQCLEIISAIRTFDTRSKGIGSRQNEYDLLSELLLTIYSARGKISLT